MCADLHPRRIQYRFPCTGLWRHLERVEKRLTRLEDAVEAGSRYPGCPGELGDRRVALLREHMTRPREDSHAGRRVHGTKLDETSRLVKYQSCFWRAVSIKVRASATPRSNIGQAPGNPSGSARASTRAVR